VKPARPESFAGRAGHAERVKGTRLNAINLCRLSFAEQSGSHDVPRLVQAIVFFVASLESARLDSVLPQRVDLQVAQGDARPCVAQSAVSVCEADPVNRDLLAVSSDAHDRAD